MALGAFWKGGHAGGFWPAEFWRDGFWFEGDGTVAYDSVYYRILSEVVTTLRALNLPHILTNATGQSYLQAERVYLEKVPNWRNKPLPSVIVYPLSGEDVGGEVNARDDIGYAVGILFAFSNDQNQADNLALEFRWRQMIRRAFNQKKLDRTRVPEQFNCETDSMVVYDNSAFWTAGIDLARIGLRFTTREIRDPTA